MIRRGKCAANPWSPGPGSMLPAARRQQTGTGCLRQSSPLEANPVSNRDTMFFAAYNKIPCHHGAHSSLDLANTSVVGDISASLWAAVVFASAHDYYEDLGAQGLLYCVQGSLQRYCNFGATRWWLSFMIIPVPRTRKSGCNQSRVLILT